MDKIAAIDRRVAVRSADEGRETEIRRISDLRREPFVILLGEPGIGKSTVMQTEAKVEGATVLRVRQLVNGHSPVPGSTLFIDGLDEYRSDGSAADKSDKLALAIAESKADRWRLSCRSEDWLNAKDIAAIQGTSGGTEIVVAQLLPLDEREAGALLKAWGEADPEGFLEHASRMGVAAFTQNPLGLIMLQKAVQKNGTWPSTRFEVMSEGTLELAHEQNFERTHEGDWSGAPDIIAATAKSCLMLLTTGAYAIWRSNAKPPTLPDNRALPTRHDLKLSPRLFRDMLDTPLWRGEGDAFEPMHRVVAEFLAAKALAEAVAGGKDRAALPLSRAIAMITGSDGRPPTELRGLYAWFAAHLAKAGDAAGAKRLIEADAVTVLAYGDASAFETAERRAILENIDRGDPYFRSSETGVTAYGGLAGEDLADDFRATLTAPVDSQKFLTVLDVLTIGAPVHSLRPLLGEIAMDRTRPEWQRWRAADAWLNGDSNPQGSRLQLLDDLDSEEASTAREILRVHLAGDIPVAILGVARVRSILADFEAAPDDNTVGHLFSLEQRLVDEPTPELFAVPTDSWRAPEGKRSRGVEIEHMLDRVLAESIGKCSPTSSQIWQWTRNVGGTDALRHMEGSRKAVAAWLDADASRENEILDLVLSEYQPDSRPWLLAHDFVAFAQRGATRPLVLHLLHQADQATHASKQEWLRSVAVYLVRNGPADPAAYWEVYDHLAGREGCGELLDALTTTHFEEYRLRQRENRIARNREAESRIRDEIEVLSSDLKALREGRSGRLVPTARRYFAWGSGERPLSLDALEAEYGSTIADAITDGWRRLAAHSPDFVDARQLGTAAGENKSYHVEHPIVAGVDLLIQRRADSELASLPIPTALVALKSGFIARAEQRRGAIYDWVADRLDADPSEGAVELEVFWSAALDAGGSELEGLWQLTNDGRKARAASIALAAMLGARPAMPEKALKRALIAAFDLVEGEQLQQLADAALGNADVRGRNRLLWGFVRFTLDPLAWLPRFLDDCEDATAADIAFLDWDGGMGKAVEELEHQLVRLEAVARIAGARSTPDDRFASNRADLGDLADATHGAITTISMSVEADAGIVLRRLAGEPSLSAWHRSIGHAIAEQARLRRDAEFRHPNAAQVAEALAGGAPVNASDLRAIAVEELKRLGSELRSVSTDDWKMFWNLEGGIPATPRIENECRNYVLSRLHDRMLEKYRIAAAVPEGQHAGETRADMLILSGTGRTLPVEVKRHYHAEVWTAAATQLQGYASAPGADGLGIYLVIWFGADVQPTPPRPHGTARPTTAAELEGMLKADLPERLRERTDVIVFDASRPHAVAKRQKTRSSPRRQKSARRNRVR